MLPLWVKVDLGAMAVKEYFTLPKALALLEPPYQIVWYHIKGTRWVGSGYYLSAEIQSVCSIAPAKWALLFEIIF